jgi:putative membrane protein
MIASIAAFVTLILWSGAGEILHGIRMIGWGLVVLVGFRLVALTLAGLAWGTLFGRRIERPASVYIGLRLIREAINCLLPAAQVGGDLIGARLLARTGVPAGLAGAGILVDILLQASTQGVFALIGLAALWTVFGDGPVVREAGVGLILAVPALGGFFLAQRLGLFLLVDRGLGTIERLFPAFSAGGRIDLHPSLRLLYSDHAALARASLIHLAGWSVGTAEIWVALGQMGMGPSFAECLVLESLGQAVRSAGFAVPGALGIQEGGFILLGAIFGLTPPTAVALSIAKRLPDFAIGIPGLIAWQCLEAARLKTQPKHR